VIAGCAVHSAKHYVRANVHTHRDHAWIDRLRADDVPRLCALAQDNRLAETDRRATKGAKMTIAEPHLLALSQCPLTGNQLSSVMNITARFKDFWH